MLWYQAFDCRGDQEEVLAKIDERIARCNLSDRVSRLCLQPLLGKEFLLYIGIESPRLGSIPPAVEQKLFTLTELRIRNASCPPKEVASVYEAWQRRTQGRVNYRPPAAPVLSADEDARVDGEDDAAIERTLEQTHLYDRLLTYLSARGEGPWETFRGSCAALWPNAEKQAPAQILRRLKILGHVAVAPDRSRWRALRPLLVPQPDNDAGDGEDADTVYLLCGQRDCALLEALRGVGTVHEEAQPAGDGPAAVTVTLPSGEGPAWPPSVGLSPNYQGCVGTLPTLAEWRRSLPVVPPFATYEYEFRLFDGRHFQPRPFQQAPGLYEVWTLPASPTDAAKCERTLYYDSESECWRSGAWYDLRFLAHLDRGWERQIAYRETPEPELIVPDAARFPEAYERALAISTGFLPYRRRDENGQLCLVYSGVPRSVATSVSAKLELHLA